jgi:hypothetical protein
MMPPTPFRSLTTSGNSVTAHSSLEFYEGSPHVDKLHDRDSTECLLLDGLNRSPVCPYRHHAVSGDAEVLVDIDRGGAADRLGVDPDFYQLWAVSGKVCNVRSQILD